MTLRMPPKLLRMLRFKTAMQGDFMAALRLITDARGGIGKIAQETGLNRGSAFIARSQNRAIRNFPACFPYFMRRD